MQANNSLSERATYTAKAIYRKIRCLPLKPEPTWQRVNHDFEMKLSSQDVMDRTFFVGDYDPALLCAIGRFVAQGDHCIDIGAHKGYVTLSLSSLVGEEGKVFAFEPDADVRNLLLGNIAHNERRNVQVFPFALGPEEGEATFFVSKQSGWSSRFPNELAQARIKSQVTVPIKVVDRLVSTREMAVEPSRLSFVKIDCEGSEPGVLAGMKDLLAGANPVLWIEVNRGSLRAAQSSIQVLENIIQDLGLNMYTFEFHKSLWGKPHLEFRPVKHIDTEQENAFDIVATKQALV